MSSSRWRSWRWSAWTDGAALPALRGSRRGQDAAVARARPAAAGAGEITRVAVVCPTTPLTRQWAQAAGALGVHLAPDAPDLAAAARLPRRRGHLRARRERAGGVRADSAPPGTLVIADEAHHLGEELAWGEGFAPAFGAAERRLLLSGTPFRSDATPIPGVRYDRDGVAVPDVTYGYADAVRDGICRPVTFIPFDGTLQWRSGDDVIEAAFDDVLIGREASRRYRTAISVELADGLPRILREAHERLERVRRSGGHRDAGGLVVAADSEHARAVAKVLREVTGEAPTVVVHTEAKARTRSSRRSATRASAGSSP